MDVDHKALASAFNNAAWDLLERARTPEEDLALLDAAHAANAHWGKVGGAVEKRRAALLVAAAHAQAGAAGLALALAADLAGAEGLPDWEEALTLIVLAMAEQAAGTDAAGTRAKAEAAFVAISKPGEQAVLAPLLEQLRKA